MTVFEAQRRIGGLWPLSKDDGGGLLHPLMLANQSKHTMQFSDLAWDAGSPELPRAWQVGQYLQRYWTRYCSAAEMRLGCRVERTEMVDGGRWSVTVHSPAGDETHVFDHLAVCTGYFGKPVVPAGLPAEPAIPVIHSSKYRDLQGLLGKAEGGGGKILVVGGQFSGFEIAGTIANHLSAAANSPDLSPIPDLERYSVHHLIKRPPWVFPLFTSPKVELAASCVRRTGLTMCQATLTATPFLPLDLPSYNLASRPHPLRDSQGHIPVESARIHNSIYQSVVGTDQSEFSPLLTISSPVHDEPPYLAVSDTYMDHTRSGLITISKGRLSSLAGSRAIIAPNDEEITDLAAVVLATGFGASPSLSFLPETVLTTLALAPSDLNNTVALAFHGTHHPSLPSLGFVGFYRSPYWGVVEMQARFMTALWSHPPSSRPAAMQQALTTDRSIERTLALRGDPRASQFPMGDYAYLMQEFAAALELPLVPAAGPMPPLPHNGKGMDILTPARYPPRAATADQLAENAMALRQTLETAVAGLTRARFVARAVFRSLLGSWDLRRTVISALPSHPSGTFVGTARFLLRDGTSPESALEYLYIEDGNFTASGAAGGLSFRATRRYVWRYDEARDVLSVWFVRTDNAKMADYLFHEVEFLVPDARKTDEESGQEKGWEAQAGHLCVEDFYDVRYEFRFRAVNLEDWKIGYDVKGPKKDYRIDGVYTRPRRS